MRKKLASLMLGALFLLNGCTWMQTHNGRSYANHIPRETPTPQQLVNYLNDNASRVNALECKVFIDAKGPQGPVGLECRMALEKPRNFRLAGTVLGKPAVDIGSNDQEFWYWMSQGEPYVYHCSYEDLRRGVRTPLPFQPEWMVEAMGLAQLDLAKERKVNVRQTTLEMVEETVSPQGQPVRKVTVFARGRAAPGKPQVLAHILQDMNGKVICSANISEVKVDYQTGAILPVRMVLSCPSEKTELKMHVERIQVAPIDPGRKNTLFSRAGLSNIPGFDLAQGRPDGPPGDLKRVGGLQN